MKDHKLLETPWGWVWCDVEKREARQLLPRRQEELLFLHPILRDRPTCGACGRLL
jgi:hypothetical protein